MIEAHPPTEERFAPNTVSGALRWVFGAYSSMGASDPEASSISRAIGTANPPLIECVSVAVGREIWVEASNLKPRRL